MMNDKIIIKGARENNLKNISLEIPKNQLVVITGVSGSGKSSLAFDTIYAEGQRRYLESLSSYARQFLGSNDKPDVDAIEGLSPAIAIDQKSTSNNPRSTVGTITEIYDYLRVLYARIGTPFCPNGHGPIKTQTLKQIVDAIMEHPEGTKLQLLAPMVSESKGTFSNLFFKLKKDGYLRVRVDNQVLNLDDVTSLDKNTNHNIDVIVDRVVIHHDQATRSRLNDTVENALKLTNGKLVVWCDDQETFFSENYACDTCGFSIPELEPRLFSFNSPIGACPTCKGLGFIFEPDESKIFPDLELSIADGGIDYFKNTVNTTNLDWQRFESLIKHYQISMTTPIGKLSKKEINLLLYGSDAPIEVSLTSANNRAYSSFQYVEGISDLIKRRHAETSSEMAREHYSKYMSQVTCKNCQGKRLNEIALSVMINQTNIIDLTEKDIRDELDFFAHLNLTPDQEIIAKGLLKEIQDRCHFLDNVGLNYLTLARSGASLSGGESQRIRLATQIGSHLTGIMYVLDEPSIGLHQRDNDKLIETMMSIRDLGNTVIVVEHDEDTMRMADYLIDIGPKAGVDGGYVMACGTPDQVMHNPNSLTGQYLSGQKFIPVPKTRRNGNGKKVVLKGATGNNLKNVTLSLPLNKFVVVTGVSGSGKSTLIMDTLVPAIAKANFNPFIKPLPYRDLVGANHVDKIVEVSQEPIGRTPRSNPATYVGVFDDIRSVFADTPDAKEKGYSKGRFSFNVKGGRCERCQGDGVIKIDMQFLPTVYVVCEECSGKRYNEETLNVKYKGKTIFDVLNMSVDDACEFFKNHPIIHKKLILMQEVGLGYLSLGASSTQLSGGEAQRIKLAKFLQRKATGKTLFVLDEPTTGLHVDDIQKLINVLNKIVDNGDTVLIIEHNLDLIKVADHIIDIGPDGGQNGGTIIAEGTPEEIVNNPHSVTGPYLKKYLI